MSLDQLVVKQATRSQSHEVVLRNASHWGTNAGISADDYVKLSEIFQEGVFTRDGRHTVWVLVPESDPDTTDFYASCQVFAREVLTLQPGQSAPVSSFGHAASSVFVNPEHRGKGYAGRLMSLLHSALAPHRYPNPLKVLGTVDQPSTVSVLYSAVGDYYARCAPSQGETGWTLQKTFVTTWSVSTIRIPSAKGDLPAVELLSESDVEATLSSDDPEIPTDLLRLQKKDPTKTYFAFAPTAPLNAQPVMISKLAPGCPSNPSWGAKIPGTGDFMTWVFFHRPGLRLVATRLRASTESFSVLLDAAVRTARDTKSEHIEIWNVPEHLKEITQATGGETTERRDNLWAFKWYGQQSEPKGENSGVVWALDERYSWC
ncbi:hypothetical protein RSOLAG1IB_09679 [Rhizoctonia solani AG-1 IB]|uniref:LYC1 C-terminal domain-containing protein n=1 Tax=Thanatephorus cucumeris (strain AG1-IB / isolate 7/3/14) TaxID=1108050 RepID=A0A0B7FR71_THACB|nr:hypothetical protein RSOLAG1IB_09679 [Rhizoctonia solani AG-1 IB]